MRRISGLIALLAATTLFGAHSMALQRSDQCGARLGACLHDGEGHAGLPIKLESDAEIVLLEDVTTYNGRASHRSVAVRARTGIQGAVVGGIRGRRTVLAI